PSAHSRHTNISEDAVESLGRKEVKGLTTTRCKVNPETFALKQISKQFAHCFFVVNYQDLWLRSVERPPGAWVGCFNQGRSDYFVYCSRLFSACGLWQTNPELS